MSEGRYKHTQRVSRTDDEKIGLGVIFIIIAEVIYTTYWAATNALAETVGLHEKVRIVTIVFDVLLPFLIFGILCGILCIWKRFRNRHDIAWLLLVTFLIASAHARSTQREISQQEEQKKHSSTWDSH